MLAAVASLAPEPTLIVTPAPPLDPAVPVAARLGTPVLDVVKNALHLVNPRLPR